MNLCLAYLDPFREIPFWLPLGAFVLGVLFCWLGTLTAAVQRRR